MNFYELNAKLKALEEGTVEECGPMGAMVAPQGQQDNVSVNVNMSGQGKGGIRDLMNVLKGLEDGGEEGEVDVLVGEPGGEEHGHEEPIMGDEDREMDEVYGNSPKDSSGPHVQDIKTAITQRPADDMNSKAKASPLARAPGTNTLRQFSESASPELVQRLQSMYETIKNEVQEPSQTSASPQRGGHVAAAQPGRQTGSGAIDPVRNNPVNAQTQNVAPQANRPGLASNGDPKLWDIQHELAKQGYKIKVDGLNGPETEKIARQAGLVHDFRQDIANPNAASYGQQIGHAIGSGIGWIETAWRNLKQGFSQGQQGLEESQDLTDIKKLSGL